LTRAKLLIILALVLALASCETAQQRKPLGVPPAQALAPQPLPLVPPPPVLNNSPIPNAAAAEPTAISNLIDKAEAAYTEGLNDYQSGNMEKAKQEFDKALSTLLESAYDINSDNRLSEEFNLLTDNINDVEMATLKNGSSLSQQYVPTPIESFAGLTFPVDPNVMQRVQQEMRSIHSDIPLVSNAVVSGAIAYLQSHARGYIENVLKRLGQYRPMISKVLRKQGLPQDLIYLAGPESAFNPYATSRKGAKGMWQLMSGTAALHGLKENRWVDERRDPLKSTQAAAAELKDLYQTFGDWYLALAAYDSGPLTVQRAIQRTGYADYWTLRRLHALPPETENYVPVFLATALIAKDPAAYGFDVKPDPALQVDHVAISAPTDLRLVAELIDAPVDELVQLNPGLKGWATPANDPGFELNLPAGTKGIFEQRIASIPPSDRLWWRAHQVKAGETLVSVASHYHITTTALAEANHLERDSTLTAGAHLVIPLVPSRARLLERASLHWVRRPYYYRVHRGDNLDLIADRFDVTTYQLRRWNHLRNSRLATGRKLLVYRLVPVAYPHRSHRKVKRRHYARRRVLNAHHNGTSRTLRSEAENIASGPSPAR
jgi:membrane-bound lytic murein transglycosylase D